jgi:hypothetical protein
VLRNPFRRSKPEVKAPAPDAAEPSAEETAKVTVDVLLMQTSGELNKLGVMYAVASIATGDQQAVLALRSASLRLEKLSRQFEMSARLLSSGQIDED